MSGNVVVLPHRVGVSTFDTRWAAWVARGVEQDKQIARRVIAGAVVLVAALGVWLTILIFG